jgi:hypothetical protein
VIFFVVIFPFSCVSLTPSSQPSKGVKKKNNNPNQTTNLLHSLTINQNKNHKKKKQTKTDLLNQSNVVGVRGQQLPFGVFVRGKCAFQCNLPGGRNLPFRGQPGAEHHGDIEGGKERGKEWRKE